MPGNIQITLRTAARLNKPIQATENTITEQKLPEHF